MFSDNIWTLVNNLLKFFTEVAEKFIELWNTEFEIGDYLITFPQMATTFLIVLMGLMFVKKFIF